MSVCFSGRTSPTDTKSEKSTITQYTGFSSVTQGTAHGSKSLSDGAERPPRLQGSFVSLQVEKVGYTGTAPSTT